MNKSYYTSAELKSPSLRGGSGGRWEGFCLFFVLCTLIFTSCETREDDYRLAFIGDSNIERWDVCRFFPTFITENYGKSNSGLNYLEEFAGKFNGKRVVVLTGTNDLGPSETPDEMSLFLDMYSERYERAIENLGAAKIYIFSVLPTNTERNDMAFIKNDIIKEFNQRMKRSAAYHGWTYLDVYSMLLIDEQLNPSYTLDGLHPNDACYEILTNQIIRNY